MNRQALEAKDSAARFGGVYVETYRGYKIRVQRGDQWGTLRVSIAGSPIGDPYGRTNTDALRQADVARGYIDASHERPEAYTWSCPVGA